MRWIDSYGSEQAPGRPRKEILFTVRARLHDKGFAIVDAATLKATFVKVNFYAGNNTGSEDFVWAPGGNEIALTVSQIAGNERLADQVTAIRFYNRSGKLTRTIPATAALRSAQAFSLTRPGSLSTTRSATTPRSGSSRRTPVPLSRPSRCPG